MFLQRTTICLFVICILAALACAEVPQTINYQGYLKNSSGTPVSATTTVRFSLYSSNPARNNPVWRETKNVTPANGIYSTQLGSVAPVTAPFDVPYWLGIKVAADNEMALQPLGSVPYALRAKQADGVSGSGQLTTTVATGTAPLQVLSTTQVTNLNADMVDGKHADEIISTATTTLQPTITNLQTQITDVASNFSSMLSWGIPQSISVFHFGEEPKVAVNASGNGVALWKEGDYENNRALATSFYTAGVGWSNLFEEIQGTTFTPSAHQVAIDSAGNVTAVWNHPDGTEYRVWSRRYTAGAGWGTTQRVDSSTGSSHEPHMASNAAGSVIVVWPQWDAGKFNIWANRYVPGVGWGTAQLIENNPGNARQPRVGMDNSGNAVVVWDHEDGAAFDIWYNTFSVTSGWGTARVLENFTEDDAMYPQISVNKHGNAVALWGQSNGARFSFYDKTSGWGEALVPLGSGELKLILDNSGAVFAVWSEMSASYGNIWSNRYVPGVGWGTSQKIGNDNLNNRPENISLSLNDRGDLAVVWQLNDGINHIWSNRYVSGSGWGTPQPVENSASLTATAPSIALDDNGNALSAWSQNYIVHANRETAAQGLALANIYSSASTVITAPDSTASRVISLPDVTGTVITSGNLTDISVVGTVTGGEWKATTVAVAHGGTGANDPAQARYNLGVPALNTAYANPSFVATLSASKLFGTPSVDDLNLLTNNSVIRSGTSLLLHTRNGTTNTAVGIDALTAGSGTNNTAVGNNTLKLSTGHNNTATGTDALSANTSGGGNTAIGNLALTANTTGTYNTAIGLLALSKITTGTNNTAVGYNAGITSINNNNEAGTYNTFLGAGAYAQTLSPLTYATAVGAGAIVKQSNSMVLGGTGAYAVKVGIGTSTPTETLDVIGNVRLNNSDLFLRNGVDTNHGLGWYGASKQFALTSIDGPVLYGYSSGALGTTSGGQKVLLKWDSGSFDFYGYSRFRVLSSGSTSACLDANNSISTCSSDARMKKDVVALPETMDVLGALTKLRGVLFTWDTSNPKAASTGGGRDLGMIAQEVEQIFPEVVHTDSDGYKSLDYPKLVAYLIEVNKAQQAQLDSLNKRITALEAK